MVNKAFNKLLVDYHEVITLLSLQPLVSLIKDLLRRNEVQLAEIILRNYLQQKKAESINACLLEVRNESAVAYKLLIKLISALQ